ncbi:hypothetical protein [Streptomyces sp. DB-54]
MAEMVRRAARIIRRTDPGAVVVCPSMGHLRETAGLRFLREFAAADGYQACAAAALKTRQRPAERPPEEVTGELAAVNRVLHGAGVGTRLWITGPDYDIAYQPAPTGPRARDYAVRFYLMALYGVEQGVRRAYFYNWGGARIPVVLQVEGEPPTPAARAVDRLQQWLAGARLRGCGHGAAGGNGTARRCPPPRPAARLVAGRPTTTDPAHGYATGNDEERDMRLRTTIVAAVSGGILAAGTLIGGAAPASAGTATTMGGCTGPLCSETTNETGHPVLVAKDWCDKRHGPCKGTARKVLHKNRTTPKGHDWDTFYVNAHCTFRGLKHSWGIGFTERGGSHGKWVKVSDAEHFYIKKVSC